MSLFDDVPDSGEMDREVECHVQFAYKIGKCLAGAILFTLILCLFTRCAPAQQAVDGRAVVDTGVDLAACQERGRSAKADGGSDAGWRAYDDCVRAFGYRDGGAK